MITLGSTRGQLQQRLVGLVQMCAKISTVSTNSGEVKILGSLTDQQKQVLSKDAVEFLALLHRNFNDRRLDLLNTRRERQQRINDGETLNFLASTLHIREASWKIDPLPADLRRRRVEITGPPEVKMVINALNCGADAYMVDFEDSNSPTWNNIMEGQLNMINAIRRKIGFEKNGKKYQLNEKTATLLMRPRGWHLDEKHIMVNDERFSGSLTDFGLYFFHNAREQIANKSGPYFYLPKLESHLEARLWNDVFIFAQRHLDIPIGTIKATVLIETLWAAFEMDEILYELRNHSAGLNAGRWDYIFSCIKTFQNDRNFCLADRSLITMEVPFMRAYAMKLIETCHRRQAPAIGGMSALIPIKNDAEANERALNGVKHDKERDARDGFDGGWVAHPGLVKLTCEKFEQVLNGRENQIEKQIDSGVLAVNLLDFRPNFPVTNQGLKMNISVGIQYLSAWLAGNGCVPLYNLMEDAATAEISRTQVWQWLHCGAKLDIGETITKDLVTNYIQAEIERLREEHGHNDCDDRAAAIFEKLVVGDRLEEFLTLPLYENL